MIKFKTISVTAIAISAAVLTMMIEHKGQIKFRAGEARLQEQTNQLAALTFEQQRLSDFTAHAPSDDNTVELARLRSEVAMLKSQTNDLGRTNGKEP